MECVLSGRATGESILEMKLSRATGAGTYGTERSFHVGQFINRYNALSSRQKERLLGYLDALCSEKK